MRRDMTWAFDSGLAPPSCSIQFMIGGASWTWWIGFHVAVLALLIIDSLLPGTRSESKRTQTMAWVWTAVLALCAAGFAGWIAVAQGRVPALQFVAGYTIETSLSVDNLFVFLVLFEGFRIFSAAPAHRAALGRGRSGGDARGLYRRRRDPPQAL